MAHACHATGCDTEVLPRMWGCRHHWFMIPKRIRDAIWEHYIPGRERAWTPTKEYLKAAKAAVIAVAQQERRKPDTSLYDAFLEDLM